MSTEHYTYRVRWSPVDQEHVGTVAEFPSLSWLDADPRAAFDGAASGSQTQPTNPRLPQQIVSLRAASSSGSTRS